MTWVKLSDDALDDPRLLAVPRGAILMYLEALAYSNRHNLGGRIPRAALRKLTTEEDPDAAAAALAGADLCVLSDGAMQLAWLLGDQPTEEEVTATRKRWREAQDRSRKRRQLHLDGDHSTCDPRRCRVLLRSHVNDDSRDDSTDDSTHPPTPTRLRPDPEESGRGGRGAGGARSRGGARAARRGEDRCFYCANPAPDGLQLVDRGDGLRVHPDHDHEDPGPIAPGWEAYVDEHGDLGCPPVADKHARCDKCHGAYLATELRTDRDPATAGVLVVTACAPCWAVLEADEEGGLVFDGPGRAHRRDPYQGVDDEEDKCFGCGRSFPVDVLTMTRVEVARHNGQPVHEERRCCLRCAGVDASIDAHDLAVPA